MTRTLHLPRNAGKGRTAEVIRQHLCAPLPLDRLEHVPKPVVAHPEPLSAIGQQYSLKVAFTQDGQPFTAQPFEYSWPLDAVKVIADFVKLQVV